MPKKSAAQQKKVDVAVRILDTTTGVKVPQAMILAFFEYLQKSIMKLYPDAAPVKGRWVVIKCDSGPGRLNTTLLAYLRYYGFILYPGVPNTT